MQNFKAVNLKKLINDSYNIESKQFIISIYRYIYLFFSLFIISLISSCKAYDVTQDILFEKTDTPKLPRMELVLQNDDLLAYSRPTGYPPAPFEIPSYPETTVKKLIQNELDNDWFDTSEKYKAKINIRIMANDYWGLGFDDFLNVFPNIVWWVGKIPLGMFGIPFGKGHVRIEVEASIINKGELIKKYITTTESSNYRAFYYGYTNPFIPSFYQALKLALKNLKQDILNDYVNQKIKM